MQYIKGQDRTMKTLKPYWFLEKLIDVEYKYYILMDYLYSINEDLSHNKIGEQIASLNRVYEDLKAYQTCKSFSKRSLHNLTSKELEHYHALQASADVAIVEDIVEYSLVSIEKFQNKIKAILNKVESSISLYIYDKEVLFRDSGFLVIRDMTKKTFRIYSWIFSFINLDGKDQTGMIMSEILDPNLKYSENGDVYLNYLKKEIINFSEDLDCLVFLDIDNEQECVTYDYAKERAISFILASYKEYSSSLDNDPFPEF